MGRMQVKCHGDDSRFEEVAAFVYERFGIFMVGPLGPLFSLY